jgi:hypothetical protein
MTWQQQAFELMLSTHPFLIKNNPKHRHKECCGKCGVGFGRCIFPTCDNHEQERSKE